MQGQMNPMMQEQMNPMMQGQMNPMMQEQMNPMMQGQMNPMMQEQMNPMMQGEGVGSTWSTHSLKKIYLFVALRKKRVNPFLSSIIARGFFEKKNIKLAARRVDDSSPMFKEKKFIYNWIRLAFGHFYELPKPWVLSRPPKGSLKIGKRSLPKLAKSGAEYILTSTHRVAGNEYIHYNNNFNLEEELNQEAEEEWNLKVLLQKKKKIKNLNDEFIKKNIRQPELARGESYPDSLFFKKQVVDRYGFFLMKKRRRKYDITWPAEEITSDTKSEYKILKNCASSICSPATVNDGQHKKLKIKNKIIYGDEKPFLKKEMLLYISRSAGKEFKNYMESFCGEFGVHFRQALNTWKNHMMDLINQGIVDRMHISRLYKILLDFDTFYHMVPGYTPFTGLSLDQIFIICTSPLSSSLLEYDFPYLILSFDEIL